MNEMSNRDVNVLRKLVAEMDVLKQFVKNYDLKRFLADDKTQRAACMTLVNIGELVKHLSRATREAYDYVPWQAYAVLRNVMAHEYQALRMGDVWATIEQDVPTFRRQVEKILKDIAQ